MDELLDILRQERDAALEEADFERSRAEQALLRNRSLREEVGALRRELRRIHGDQELQAAGAQATELQLSEQLKLATDTNWRLERDRQHLARKAHQLESRVQDQAAELSRLRARVRALQGQLRLAQED
ncbi:MAG: hypothetical protein VX899_21240 [Myxococcota bacterium]|nr:hypothetical protein [Myxococcota bacterium]